MGFRSEDVPPLPDGYTIRIYTDAARERTKFDLVTPRKDDGWLERLEEARNLIRSQGAELPEDVTLGLF